MQGDPTVKDGNGQKKGSASGGRRVHVGTSYARHEAQERVVRQASSANMAVKENAISCCKHTLRAVGTQGRTRLCSRN